MSHKRVPSASAPGVSRRRSVASRLGLGTGAAGLALAAMAGPAGAQTPDTVQVVANPSFEQPGTNNATPTDWTEVFLGNETSPFNSAAVAFNASGQFPPPSPIPDGQFALETFWQTGDALGVVGQAAEQTADSFAAPVDEAADASLSYSTVATFSPGENVNWAGNVVEVELTAGGQTRLLRYYHSHPRFGGGTFPGAPTNSATVQYVIGQPLVDEQWLSVVQDLDGDIESRFGVSDHEVTAIRVGNLQDKTNDAFPFTNMTSYWDDVVIEAQPGPVIPEAALAVLLPGFGVVMLGAGLVARRWHTKRPTAPSI